MNQNIKILVVDESSTMRQIIKNALKQIGFKIIIQANDGATALQVLRKQAVDLIIAEWNMPKMSGFDLLKTVRGDDALKNISFLMVTAEAQKENVMQAIKTGVNGYLVKPFTPDRIKEKLEQIFIR